MKYCPRCGKPFLEFSKCKICGYNHKRHYAENPPPAYSLLTRFMARHINGWDPLKHFILLFIIPVVIGSLILGAISYGIDEDDWEYTGDVLNPVAGMCGGRWEEKHEVDCWEQFTYGFMAGTILLPFGFLPTYFFIRREYLGQRKLSGRHPLRILSIMNNFLIFTLIILVRNIHLWDDDPFTEEGFGETLFLHAAIFYINIGSGGFYGLEFLFNTSAAIGIGIFFLVTPYVVLGMLIHSYRYRKKELEKWISRTLDHLCLLRPSDPISVQEIGQSVLLKPLKTKSILLKMIKNHKIQGSIRGLNFYSKPGKKTVSLSLSEILRLRQESADNKRTWCPRCGYVILPEAQSCESCHFDLTMELDKIQNPDLSAITRFFIPITSGTDPIRALPVRLFNATLIVTFILSIFFTIQSSPNPGDQLAYSIIIFLFATLTLYSGVYIFFLLPVYKRILTEFMEQRRLSPSHPWNIMIMVHAILFIVLTIALAFEDLFSGFDLLLIVPVSLIWFIMNILSGGSFSAFMLQDTNNMFRISVIIMALTYCYYIALFYVKYSFGKERKQKVRYFLENFEERGRFPLEELGKFLLIEPLQVYSIILSLIRKGDFSGCIEGWDIWYPDDLLTIDDWRQETYESFLEKDYVPTIWRNDVKRKL